MSPDAVANKKVVSLVRCPDYGRQNVLGSVRAALDQIGGIGRFISPGQRVLLKFNLLLGAHPDKCVTTHPEVVRAVACILLEHGCTVVMGDSPGSGLRYTERTLRKAYAASGFDQVAQELGCTLNFDTSSREVPAPEGRMIKRFKIINPALDCDAMIVVSKAKTHALTYLSGAAKNLFGVIPGFDKPTYHATLQDAAAFSRMIVDLNVLLKPALQVMDAIRAMEGDGPHAGTPKQMGAVLAGSDATAVDVAVARLMSLEPSAIGTIKAAIERDLVRADLSDIAIVGEPIESLVVKDFVPPATYTGRPGKGGRLREKIVNRLVPLFKDYAPRPAIIAARCTGCLKCQRSCPAETIQTVKKDPVPRIDYQKCIRCYCCHEMCDSQAIRLERSAWGRLIARMMER